MQIIQRRDESEFIVLPVRLLMFTKLKLMLSLPKLIVAYQQNRESANRELSCYLNSSHFETVELVYLI